MAQRHQHLLEMSTALAQALAISSDLLGSMLPAHVLQRLEAKAAEVSPRRALTTVNKLSKWQQSLDVDHTVLSQISQLNIVALITIRPASITSI
jgi:hypothetical protein